MEFKVSKKKFVLNELIVFIIALIVISILFPITIGQNVIIFIMIFIYKKCKHYEDILYINKNNIKLEKTILFGKSTSSKTTKEEYKVINLYKIEDKINKYIIYGNIELKKEIYNNQPLSNYEKITEIFLLNKLIIRKNFNNDKKIKELLENKNKKE